MASKFFAVVIILVITSANLYSQTNDSISKLEKSNYNLTATNIYNIGKLNNSLIWTTKITSKTNSFSIYNETTKANDLYILNSDILKYTKSFTLNENNFRNNKIDSFNPTGASNIQSGLLMGVFNLFIKK